MKKLKHIGNTIMNWFAVNGVILSVWGILSYLEIISKNLDPAPTYSTWNLFILIFK